MANDVRTVTDPLGNTIHLLQDIHLMSCENEKDMYDSPETVISKPAMLIEVTRELKKQMYYFRYVGGERTMLILVDYNGSRWEITECIRNPPNEMLSKIMKSGKQLL